MSSSPPPAVPGTSPSLGDEVKLLLAMSLPVVVPAVITNTIGVVDLTIVGLVGREQQAGIGLGHQFMVVLETMMYMMMMGVRVLVAHNTGAGNLRGTGAIVWEGYLFGLVLLPLVVVAYVFVDPLLRPFNPPDEVRQIVVDYVRIRLLAEPVNVVIVVGSHFFYGLGKPKVPMYILIILLPTNIVLSYWFVLGGFGLPSMGANGAAWGSVASMCTGGALFLYMCFGKQRRETYGTGLPITVRRDHLATIAKLGLGITLATFSRVIAEFLLTALVSGLGIRQLSAYCVAANTSNLLGTLALGLHTGTSIIVGQRLGAQDRAGVRRAARTAVGFTSICGALLGVGLILAVQPLSNFMASTPDVAVTAASLLVVVALMQPVNGLDQAMAGILVAGGHLKLLVLGQFATIAAMFPLVWLLVYKLGLGVDGFLYSSLSQALALGLVIALGMRSIPWDVGSMADRPGPGASPDPAQGEETGG